jgi:hypothetical protein
VLFHVVAHSAQAILGAVPEDDPVDQFVRQTCQVAVLERMAHDAIASTRQQEELEKLGLQDNDVQEQASPISLQMKLKSIKRKKRNRSELVKSLSEGHLKPSEETLVEKPRRVIGLLGASRLEIIHALASACELAGFVFGKDSKYRQVLDEFGGPWFVNARNDIQAAYGEMGSTFSQWFPLIMTLGRKFLIKEKESVGTETMSITFVDAETEPSELLTSAKGGKAKKK